MSFIKDKRREDNLTREEYDSVRILFSIFLKTLFKKYLLSKFPTYDLKLF